MTKKDWAQPVELDPVASTARADVAPQRARPMILADADEPEFDEYLRRNAYREGESAAEEAGPDEALGTRAEGLPKAGTRRSAGRYLLALVAVFLVVLLGHDTYGFLAEQFGTNPIMAVVYTAIITAIVAAAGISIGRQVRDVRRLHDVSATKRQAASLLGSDGHGNAALVTARISAIYDKRPDVRDALQRFKDATDDSLNDREHLALFSRTVLRPIDDRAYALVLRSASETAVLTALSPLPFLDGVLALWRNVRMVRSVATLYGVRAGLAGSVVLLRHVVENIAFAGAAEVLSDAAVESTGRQLTAVLSAQMGQGIGNGIMSARMGLVTMRLCRPLPFSEAERPRMQHLRQQLLGQIKQRVIAPDSGRRQSAQ